MSQTWEPMYGFCASNETEILALAKTLEAIRRSVCAYGGGNMCDCKYGLTVDENLSVPPHGFGVDKGIRENAYDYKTNQREPRSITFGSEATGCPELREMIHRLLHREQPLF